MGRRNVGLGIGIPFGNRIGGVAVTYLLRATFDADDQTFVDAQVLDTVAEGVSDGQLTIVDTGTGTLSIVSNKCDLDPSGTTDLGFFSQAISRALGKGLLTTFNLSAMNGRIGWYDSTVLGFSHQENSINWNNVRKMKPSIDGVDEGSGHNPVLTESTDYSVATILGSYDVNGIAWRSGEVAASYLFGAAFYIKGGAFSTWTLIWRQRLTNLATIFAALEVSQMNGTFDDFRIPDVDLSAVLQPAALSTFTASNGTSLDAITPEVGGAWTEQSGNWDIQSNRANPDGAAIATVASGEADAMIDCTVNGGTSDNPAIVLRLSDTSNYWYVQADRANDLLELHEVNATVDTVRSSVAFTINDSTDYDLRAVSDGSEILGYIDGAVEVRYTSATLNQTVENHGIRSETTLGEFDNFAVFPRAAAIYDTEFDAV